MAKKKDSDIKNQEPIKSPVIKKRRTLAPEPEPAPAQGAGQDESGERSITSEEPTFKNLTPEENLDDPDDPDAEFDSITEPSKSIFDHGKNMHRGNNSRENKYDGTYDEVTDGVMFNPAEPPTGFDSEWVRFLNQLSADETTKSLADYIRIAPLTRRAKYRLMIYVRTLFDREFTMSNILDQNDMASLNLDKLLIDADLTLGLTRFDLSPEFQTIINLVRIKFGIKTRRSLYGFERMNVNTQRSVTENTESSGGGGMEVRKSIQQRIKDLFHGD